jgi:hypothetical protein
MLVGWLTALASLFPLSIQAQIEIDRHQVTQLDNSAVRFLSPSEWKSIDQVNGLEILPTPIATEGEYGTTIVFETVNHGRLIGKREVWAKVYSPEGHIREGMKIWLQLEPRGRNKLEFFFTGTLSEFRDSTIKLGF